MTPEDRELIAALRQQQAELQQTLNRIDARLNALEQRSSAKSPAPPAFLPPIPNFPPLPADAFTHLPPLPAMPPPVIASLPHVSDANIPPGMPPLPQLPPLPPVPGMLAAPAMRGPSVEMKFGRWLTSVSAVLFLIGLVLLATWLDTHLNISAAGKLASIGLISMIVLAMGQFLERRRIGAVDVARVVMAAGLAGLYVMLYAACFAGPLQVVTSSLLGGLVLLVWSLYVLAVSDRRKSETLALFAITLAYISTALNPAESFTLVADLFLAATAMIFLVRSGWTLVPTFAVIGTYLAMLRRLLIDENGDLVFDTSRLLAFWPLAIYLLFAWLIFTSAIILTRAPSFRGGKRLAFLSLNNAGLGLLLALTAYIAGYGAEAIGSTLINTGLLFLVVSRFAGFAEIEPGDIMAAYAAQGLALFTAGLIVVYTGIARVTALLAETFLLGVAGAFAGDRVLTVSTYIAGFFATVFAVWEIAVYAHHPWIFGFGGALIMFINAWNCRSEIRESREARSSIVLSTSCFCILGIGLVLTTLLTMVGDAALPPSLAIAALVFTFVIYYFTIYELPPIAQILLLVAQALVIFPVENGEALPWWTTAVVMAATLILLTWWSRQRTTRSGSWTIPLTVLYSLALVTLTVLSVRPYLDAQQWMVAESLLSVVFFIYGTTTRTWSLAAVGQGLLALAFYHFFFPPQTETYPWMWWAALTPVVILFATARSMVAWTYALPELSEAWRENIRMLARAYTIVATVGLARFIFAVADLPTQVAALLLLGTLFLSMSVRKGSTFGVRCSFILSGLGMWAYLANAGTDGRAMATCFNELAMLLFLSQTALLRHEGRPLVTVAETWALIAFSVLTSWIFVSTWVWVTHGPSHLTLGWAVFAFFLFIFGHIIRERRLRWCGLVVLLAAIIRVFCYDFWGLSSGYRVLTFLLLSAIALGVGFILSRRGTRETLF